eukprot:11591245-Alexandrium_andersonii.AAC.1
MLCGLARTSILGVAARPQCVWGVNMCAAVCGGTRKSAVVCSSACSSTGSMRQYAVVYGSTR